jgi:hypothetical protein
MSKQQNENTRDIIGAYKQSFDEFHGSVERSLPQYLQAFTNLQQESLETWKNFANNTFAIQKSIATKFGSTTTMPEAVTKLIQTTTQQFVKTLDIQNKIAHTILDTTTQNVKTLNSHAAAFAELNQNVINYSLSSWKTN